MEGHKKQPPNTGLERIFYLWFGARCKRVYAVSLDSWERFRCMCDHLRQGKIEGVSFVHIGLRPILFLLCQHCLPCENKHVFGWTIRTWWSQPTHMWSCGTSSEEHCVWCCSKNGHWKRQRSMGVSIQKKVACILFASHFLACFAMYPSAEWQTVCTCWNANRNKETSKHRNASQVMVPHHLKKIYARELHQVFLVLLYLHCFLPWKTVFKFHTEKQFSSFTLESCFQVSHCQESWNHIQPILGSFCKGSYEIS